MVADCDGAEILGLEGLGGGLHAAYVGVGGGDGVDVGVEGGVCGGVGSGRWSCGWIALGSMERKLVDEAAVASRRSLSQC